tara:strand:+ start:3327 stop:4031 length:705 start_codon:yes stop_codon:yes gene_type:complete
VDPLKRINEAKTAGLLPSETLDLIEKRFPLVLSGIKRIESASEINFPIAFVEPSIIIANNYNTTDIGILFARTIPVTLKNSVEIVIQISAPLVAYGLKGTIHSILAHEFLHYLELVTRISRMEIISDEISSNLFENVYSDNTRLLEPRSVFNDITLISHITKRFPSGFRDYKLEDKVMENWINKKLPVSKISLDTNTVKLDPKLLSRIKFDEVLLQKLEIIHARNSKRRRKKLY